MCSEKQENYSLNFYSPEQKLPCSWKPTKSINLWRKCSSFFRNTLVDENSKYKRKIPMLVLFGQKLVPARNWQQTVL